MNYPSNSAMVPDLGSIAATSKPCNFCNIVTILENRVEIGISKVRKCYERYRSYLTQVKCYKCVLRYTLHAFFFGAFSNKSAILALRDLHINGKFNYNRSQKKGRHTGASPEASCVPSTWGSRSDLPPFLIQNQTIMRDPKAPGQNLSKPSIEDVINQFFNENGTPQDIDKVLWDITVSAFNSEDSRHLEPLKRANLLCTYRSVSDLLFKLKLFSNGDL